MHLTRRSLGLALAGLPLASLRPAQAQASPPILLEGAWLFDGQAMTGPAALLIVDGRIHAIAPASIPDGAQRLDLAGRYVIPAMTSAHSHVGHTSGASLGRENHTRENAVAQLRRYQAFGINAVNSLGLNAPLFHELRAESRTGRLPGALLLGAGPGIGMPDGAPPVRVMNLADDQVLRPRNASDAEAAVATHADRGVDLIKIWADGLNNSAPQMTGELISAIVRAAHARNLRVAAHIFDLSQARLSVESGVDIIAHGIRDREVDDAFVAMMRQRGTWYIPTIQIDEAEYIYADQPELTEDPFFRAAINPEMTARIKDATWRAGQLERAAPRRAAVRTNQANLKKLHDAGIPIAFGTDSGGTPLRVQGFAEHRELELMVEAGLTPAQALNIATIRSSELLGLNDRGAIREGMRADLVVLGGNPLENIRNTRSIRSVMQNGQEVAGPIA
ncbi:amidohydrolase family protein [Roseomonas xinghualingensis]|uniref:amidohydrolase family protein n=1 Tax=Roseomonas xinghualingensis TaxID=2986475 RepID=UPI0021F14A79|nr:amidohydrolase family protein [Roseomonas sp. SXEYE001]MCV4206193.1 amidohydrolase family protein [Roseomonas sp. SXEYE001]